MEKTINECVEHIVNELTTFKIKKNTIIVDNETINFKHGNIEYHIYVEGPEDVHYGIYEIKDVNLSQDFLEDKTEFGDYLYVEDYLHNVVYENKFGYIKKVWKTLEKLENNDEEGDLPNIVASYFGLFH